MRKQFLILSSLGLLSAAAWAFPWDTDMVDAVYLRAFAWKMAPLPEATVSRNMSRLPGTREAPSPLTRAPKTSDIVEGKRNFDIYCTACHGNDGLGKAPVVDNKSGKRYKLAPPTLSGTGNATKNKDDTGLFYTIRDGSTKMPGYGYAMSDADVWGVVAYMRTLEGTSYKAPAAPEATP
jgi:mono/diheme cytochrome c family protein